MDSLFKQYEGVFDEKAEEPKKKNGDFTFAYSPFALQDAIGERNIKNIWIEYQKIILQGIDPEEIIYKVISKVRDMLAVQKGATANDLGIKDYPYNKSKKDLNNWKAGELLDFYEKLVTIFHESRMGKDGIGLALEKLFLSLR